MAPSPLPAIARPETEKIKPSPRIVAVSAAERYVADLVGECQAIASLFEVEVPSAPAADASDNASSSDARDSACMQVSTSLKAAQHEVGFAVLEERDSQRAGAVQLPLRPRQSKPPEDRDRVSLYLATIDTGDRSPWGGASDSVRLRRLIDPEFRRRSTVNRTSQYQHAHHDPHLPAAADHHHARGDGHTPHHHSVHSVQLPVARRSLHQRPPPNPIPEETPNAHRRPSTASPVHKVRGSMVYHSKEVHKHANRAKDRMSQHPDPGSGYLHSTLMHLHPELLNPHNPHKQSVKHTRISEASPGGSQRQNAPRQPSRRSKLLQSNYNKGVPSNFMDWTARNVEARRDQLNITQVEDEVPVPVIEAGLKDDLRHYFRETCFKTQKPHHMDGDDELGGWELHQIALELSMSVDDVLLVKSVFDMFDDDKNGTLDIEEFELAVYKLLQLQLRDQMVPADRIKSMCEWYWWDGDKDNYRTIDFREFLRWYSSNGFNEDLLLTEQQRTLRKIAKHHKVSPDYVEHIKRCFDLIDTDHSNELNISEFKQVLYKALKVPMHLELPPSRVQYFWAEIDTDGSGQAGFEEFFAWWLKYFDHKPGARDEMPFESFYKQIRRVGAKYLDPPAYPPEPNEQDDDIDEEDLSARERFASND